MEHKFLRFHFSKTQIKPINQVLRNEKKIKLKYIDQIGRSEDFTKCSGFRSRLYMPIQVAT